MKKFLIIFSFIFLFAYSCKLQKTDPEKEINPEKEIIKKVIQTAYVEGLLNEGNFEKIDKGFHPDFQLLGIGKGDEMWKYSISDWKKAVKRDLKSGKLPKNKNERVSVKFLSIDITTNVAIAKFDFYVGNKLIYTDYQSLYKFQSGWKIVSKVFYKYQ